MVSRTRWLVGALLAGGALAAGLLGLALGVAMDGAGDADAARRKPCPNGTRLHEAACIETAKRANRPNFDVAQAACLDDGRRLPTPAELQTFRLRTGQDMQEIEHTSQIWHYYNSLSERYVYAETVVGADGVLRTGNQSGGQSFRCVAAPR